MSTGDSKDVISPDVISVGVIANVRGTVRLAVLAINSDNAVDAELISVTTDACGTAVFGNNSDILGTPEAATEAA